MHRGVLTIGFLLLLVGLACRSNGPEPQADDVASATAAVESVAVRTIEPSEIEPAPPADLNAGPAAETSAAAAPAAAPAGARRYPCDASRHPCRVDRSAAVVLAADGSGDARTFLQALRLIDGNRHRTILVRPGTYRMQGSSAEFIRTACSAQRPCAIAAADPNRPPVFDWGVTTYPSKGNDPRTGLIIAAPWWILDGVVFQNAEYPVYIDASHVTVRNSTIRRSAYDGMMVSRRHGGFIRIESNRFEEIGTRHPPAASPRHAIYYNADTHATDAIIVDNDIQWCTGAAMQIKAQEAYASNKRGAGVYGLVFDNNVVLNCKDGLNFYFWIFDGRFANNSFIFTADRATQRRNSIVHNPVWLQLRSSGGNRFERNLVYYEEPSTNLIVGYQTKANDPANDSNRFDDNVIAVRGNNGRFGWNQRGAGMDAPRPMREFRHQRGGRIGSTEELRIPRSRLSDPARIRGLGLGVGASPVR